MSEEEDASEEEDWFERALRESDADEETDGEETDGEGTDWEDAEASGEGEPSDGDAFAEDFATAFQNAPSPGEFAGGADSGGADPGEFGMGSMAEEGMAETEFDEEFDSDIPRIDIGIEGLDTMIQGGVPERSLIVVMGGAGTGKTTFGLQFVRHALENDEKAVFIALEESFERVVDTANDKGWEFSEHIINEQLVVVDLDPIEMANSLTSIRNELPALIEEFGATRLVLDSVSLLEMMYGSQANRRNQIYDFTQSLKQAGVTTMLTSEVNEDNPYASRFGVIEYLTDAVFVLRYIRPEDFRETRLAIEIQKIRDANHSRETKPYEITDDGINVYQQANIF